MSELKLKNCPFCNCTMSVRSNRDWHRPEGDHEDHCPVDDTVLMYPATDIGLSALVNCWNTRVPQPEATKPAQDLGAAILALPLPNTTLTAEVAGYKVPVYGAQHMRDFAMAALASPADALVVGDALRAAIVRMQKASSAYEEKMNTASSLYSESEEYKAAVDDLIRAAIQAQKDGHG